MNVGSLSRGALAPKSVRPRVADLALVGLVLGPYLFGGIRTAHVLAVTLVAAGVVERRRLLRSPLVAAFVVWVSIGVIAGVETVARGASLAGAAADVLDVYFAPASFVLVGASVRSSERVADPLGERRLTVTRLSAAVMVVLALNTLVAMASVVVDLSPVLGRFWTSAGEADVAVALSAEQARRFSGVFNQPFEAGLAYSIGLVLSEYTAGRVDTRIQRLAVPLLVIGGFLSASKVILVGVFVVVAMRLRHGARRLSSVAAGAALAATIWALSGSELLGVSRLLRIFSGDLSGAERLGRLTGERFGVRMTTQSSFEGVVDQHGLLFGVGFDTPVGPRDNAVLAVFADAGVVGVLLFVVVLALLGLSLLGARFSARQRAVNAALFLLTVAACVGGPALSVNRAAELLWLALGILGSGGWRPTSGVGAHRPRPEGEA